MNDIGEWIKLLGGLAGLAALAWRIVDEFGSYLRIAVKADVPKDGWVTVLTTVGNKGNRPKYLLNAFLLVGPESEGPVESARIVAPAVGCKGEFQSPNDLWKLRAYAPVYANGRAFIPLVFFYLENVRIEDETLTYRVPVDVRQLRAGLPYAGSFLRVSKGDEAAPIYA